jgi:AcrR family transcriptional regulator
MPPGAASTVRSKVEERLIRGPRVVELAYAVRPARYSEKNRPEILNMRELFQQAATEGAQGMPRHDWLVGRDRRSEAAERIYAAAADLIARRGYEAFTIEALAARVHCSPATIYRHAGGKAAIRDAVVAIQATRIVDSARQAIKDLKGPDRVVTATIVALHGLQADPLAHLMQSTHATPVSEWITSSPAVTGFAGEMLGLENDDPLAAQWLIRVFLALWCWPIKDPAAQRTMLQRFLGPPYRNDD